MPRLRLRGSCLALAVALQGCAMTANIRSDAVSYEGAIEDLTDKFLVENVLRARDKAPQHFVDIPSIHETLQSSASLGVTVPLAEHGGTTALTATPSMGIQVNPAFDLIHLEAKDFVTGIASPIDPKFVKYWLDRGLDYRVVMFLFFAQADIDRDTDGFHDVISIRNAPREAVADVLRLEREAPVGEDAKACGSSDFSRYMMLVNALGPVTAHAYLEKDLVAGGLDFNVAGHLKDFGALNRDRFELAPLADGRFDLYALAGTHVTLCYDSHGARRPLGFAPGGKAASDSDETCRKPVVVVPLPPASATSAATSAARAAVRAVPAPAPASARPPRFLARGDADYCKVFVGHHALLAASAPAPAADPMTPAAAKTRYTVNLRLRSVGEMIQFLGDLVAYQEQLESYRVANRLACLREHGTPVTLGKPSCPPRPGDVRQVLFRLDDRWPLQAGDVAPLPPGLRLKVRYRDHDYAVGDFSDEDHTLEVLAVLHQLIDLNKSATDLRPSPFVQVLP